MASNRFFPKAATLVAGAAIAAAFFSASPASATTAAREAGAPIVANGMKFYDDYWTLQACKDVGEWGKSAGKWKVYVCQASPWDWDLYYDN